MARGWESKGVEEQVATRESGPPAARQPGASASIARARQELELQREQVLNARTRDPHRRAALAAALEQIEQRLANLG